MPTNYTTPGVYVEEISTLPPSVAEVSTAIPAFLGYTEEGTLNRPFRVTTFREFEEEFGGPPALLTAATVEAGAVKPEWAAGAWPLLYYSLRLYFDNGGGPCYVVSIGTHVAPPSRTDFQNGLAELKRQDEPTLIVAPDATRLANADFCLVCQDVLRHCGEMRDRFAILDVRDLKDPKDATSGLTPEAFRTNVSSDYLSYGAAYTPYLVTGFAPGFRDEDLTVNGVPVTPTTPTTATFEGTVGGLKVTYTGVPADAPKMEIKASDKTVPEFAFTAGPTLTVSLAGAGPSPVDPFLAEWTKVTDKKGFALAKGTATDVTVAASVALTKKVVPPPPVKLAQLKTANTGAYNLIKAALGRLRITLPPSAAMAGVYARVDRDRGVWKAPANVAVESVVALTKTLTDEEQGGLNVDPTSGKSINAIRSFVGRGTLVWGARTLAGNDNEWRYVPVRRLFIMIEESTRKASAFAVFEPNTSTTWLKVKAMIESFLYGLWERGALAGSTPEAAYFVNVGLGTTMTAQDILEGRLIVEIGVAAVRPSEFIILRFSHKLQEA